MFDNVSFDWNELIRAKCIHGEETIKVAPRKKKSSGNAGSNVFGDCSKNNNNNPSQQMSVAQYEEESMKQIPAMVIAFSGAQDNQTAADVGDASSFQLRPVTGPEKAGGATTNAFHSVLEKQKTRTDKLTYSRVLLEMHDLLKKKKYSQIPSLSTTHQIDLTRTEFSLDNPKARGKGRRRALIMSCNYYGSAAQLDGCHNDAKMQLRWLREQGWPVDDPTKVRILSDKKPDDDSFRSDGLPTAENMINGMMWLTQNTMPGDSLLLHWSGHGNSERELPDENGEYHEDDGMDETLVPVDYQTAGQIRDNTVFKLLVPPLEKGVQLLCFFDCCHSGTVCDLNYTFTVDNINLTALENVQGKIDSHHHHQAQQQAANSSNPGATTTPAPPADFDAMEDVPSLLMQANPEFDFVFAKQLLDQVRLGGFEAMPEVFKTLLVGEAARMRSLKLHMGCLGICFGAERGRQERRKGEKKAKTAAVVVSNANKNGSNKSNSNSSSSSLPPAKISNEPSVDYTAML